VDVNDDGRSRRFSKWITSARRYRQRVERHRWLKLPTESVRRFNRIDGKHLALVITLNIFVAIIPLVIVAYAVITFTGSSGPVRRVVSPPMSPRQEVDSDAAAAALVAPVVVAWGCSRLGPIARN
jgi:hypothetical protein